MKRFVALASMLIAFGLPAPSLMAAEAPAAAPAGLLDPSKDKPGLAVGDAAPKLTLKDAAGKPVELGDLYAKGPVVVTFYRGGWCPFCTKALKDWNGKAAEFDKAGATLVFITAETPESAKDTGEKNAPGLRIVSDADGSAAKAFRVGFGMPPGDQEKYKGYGVDLSKRNASGKWELPAPGTFVVDKAGKVTFASADWDYKKRVDPSEVMEAVKKAASR